MHGYDTNTGIAATATYSPGRLMRAGNRCICVFATLLKDRTMTTQIYDFLLQRIDSVRALPRLIGGRRI